MLTFEISSDLTCSVDEAWRQATTPELINRELAPLAKMTFPRHLAQLDADSVPIGERLCRSWILLFGVLPVDYDDVCFEAIWPGRGFQEASTLGTQRVWRHRRTIEALDGGCRLTDRLEFDPRVPGTERLSEIVVRALFRHRHRRLRQLLG